MNRLINMTTSNIEDISNNCRLCLKSGSNVRSIFGENKKKWAVTDISQLIYDCTKIEVSVTAENLYNPHGDIQIIFLYFDLKGDR